MTSAYLRLHIPVWATYRDVIRAARGRLNPACRYARAFRDARHEYLRAMLKQHRRARAIYAQAA